MDFHGLSWTIMEDHGLSRTDIDDRLTYGWTLVLVKLLSWLKMLKLMLGIWLTLEFVMHHQQVPIVMLSTYELSIISIYFIKCYLNTLNLWNTCKQGFFGDRAVFCHNANTKSLWRSFIRFNKQNTPVWSWIYILTKTKIRVFCLNTGVWGYLGDQAIALNKSMWYLSKKKKLFCLWTFVASFFR